MDKTKFGSECPVISASDIEYEIADRTRAISSGGIGLVHRMAKRLELDQAINRRLNLFKIYLPYAESDHGLNIAYNLLAGGTCLEHLELRRNDETWPDALGAQRIPDPTTAGDFCRRFSPLTISLLMDVFNDMRLKVWQQQTKAFFEEAIVEAREFKDIRLVREWVAEFPYRPTLCQQTYRVVVVWKELQTHQGQQKLFDDSRCFFYITNGEDCSAEQVVFEANDRCEQENLIQQHKSGVHALAAPLDNLESNWAYMVMASLAWSLKAWTALLVPVHPRWKEKHERDKRLLLRMDFSTYRNAFMNLPASD